MNLKKSLAALVTLAALLMPFAYTALAGDAPEEKLSVVSVNFPGFDFARRIVGDRAEASMLLAPGAESHTYEPAPRDILKIQNCDLFIYTGGHSEAWVEDILSSMDRQIPVLRMMDAVDVVADVTIEGMTEGEHGHGHEDHGDDAHGDEAHEDDAHGDEGHEDEDHGHDAHEDDARGDEDHEGGHVHGHDDEHVWTSPVNAMAIEQAIADKLAQIDPDGAQVYQANAQEYAAELDALDRQFRDFFAGVENKTIIVGDRFPLRYFTDEYGLAYHAAFPGCSTESEPSAATIAYLIDKVRAEDISTVFYIEFSNRLVAESIAEQTGAATALIHSCHNVSRAELDAGTTYLSLMANNLETLKEAMK